MIGAPGSAERVARNAALKVLGQATRFGSLVLVIATARVLGPGEFGKFTFAYALATVLGIVLDFGISVVLTRAVARDPGAIAERWGTAATLKLMLLGLAGPVYLAVPLLMHRPWDTVLAVWLLGLAITLQAFLENAVAVFTAVQRLEHELQMRLLEKGVLVTVGFAALAARRRAPRHRGGVRRGRERVPRLRGVVHPSPDRPARPVVAPRGGARARAGAGAGRPGPVPRRRHLAPRAGRARAPGQQRGGRPLRRGGPRLRRRVGGPDEPRGGRLSGARADAGREPALPGRHHAGLRSAPADHAADRPRAWRGRVLADAADLRPRVRARRPGPGRAGRRRRVRDAGAPPRHRRCWRSIGPGRLRADRGRGVR